MTRIVAPLLFAAVSALSIVVAHATDTRRNPVGTAAPPSSTLRNAATPSQPATPQPKHGTADPVINAGGDTRPPLGSVDSPALGYGEDGHNRPVGSPGLPGQAGVANPVGAQQGGGLTPNGGTAVSGSKPAPMQANGVRKVE